MEPANLSLPPAAEGFGAPQLAQNPLFGGSPFNQNGTQMDLEDDNVALSQPMVPSGDFNPHLITPDVQFLPHIQLDGSVIYALTVMPKDEVEMKEFCLLYQDKDPQAYVLNKSAISEMERIAEAAHMKENFRIMQPTFFAADRNEKNLRENILSTPNVLAQNFPSVDSLFGPVTLNSSYSTSHLSSGVGSFRSIDSNILDNSYAGSSMSRVPSMRMGHVDMQTARELANLEAQKRSIKLRIQRTKECVVMSAYKEISQSDTELYRMKRCSQLVMSMSTWSRSISEEQFTVY